MGKMVKILLAAVTASFAGFVAWVVVDIIQLAKGDAFGFDVFDDYGDN